MSSRALSLLTLTVRDANGEFLFFGKNYLTILKKFVSFSPFPGKPGRAYPKPGARLDQNSIRLPSVDALANIYECKDGTRRYEALP